MRNLGRAHEAALRRAIERLPEKYRVPLMLYADGKSYGQIREIARTKEGMVKSRIRRGKAILRRRLRGYL
jgi:DNA-directed RNA polymerase specialized sigma24 family protein